MIYYKVDDLFLEHPKGETVEEMFDILEEGYKNVKLRFLSSFKEHPELKAKYQDAIDKFEKKKKAMLESALDPYKMEYFGESELYDIYED